MSDEDCGSKGFAFHVVFMYVQQKLMLLGVIMDGHVTNILGSCVLYNRSDSHATKYKCSYRLTIPCILYLLNFCILLSNIF